MALPFRTTGSLLPAFAPASPVGVAVNHSYAIALGAWFPIRLRVASRASVTFWEATAPVKLPTRQCPDARSGHTVRHPKSVGWYFTFASTGPSGPASKAPTYATQSIPSVTVKL